MSEAIKNALKSKVGTQDWFYHAPSKMKEINNLYDGPTISQIPGLSTQDEQGLDETEHFRRKWLRDTDSDYVKLAKTGGRKDILNYREGKRPSQPIPYPRVDWFDDSTDEKPEPVTQQYETPEWYGHEEYTHNNNEEMYVGDKKRPLLGFDGLTTWNRVDNSAAHKKGKNRKSKSAPEGKKEFKLPPIVQKKTMDGDMGSLLSFKYQSDFLTEMNEKNIARRKDLLEEKQTAKNKIQRERDMFKKKKKPEKGGGTEKPLFKLSRFDNVSSKVVTYR